MIKGWLSQIVSKLRELAPEECKKVASSIGVEVDSGGENSGWVVHLAEGRIDPRSKRKDEARVTFYLSQNYLRALSINLRSKYWREAFEAKNVTFNAQEPALVKSLGALVKAVEKKETASP